MRIDGFFVFVTVLVLVLLATSGLFLHLLWSLDGWSFIGGIAVSGSIAAIALYAFWDLVRGASQRVPKPE
jgi:protein-S-isoprenylcysteine O-methyltransferase Ste14